MFCKLSAKSRWRQSLLCFSGGLVMAFILASARAARNIFKQTNNEDGSPAKNQAAVGLRKPRLVAQPGLF